jgi:hypothetical protein
MNLVYIRNLNLMIATPPIDKTAFAQLHRLHTFCIASFELTMGKLKGAEVQQYACVIGE